MLDLQPSSFEVAVVWHDVLSSLCKDLLEDECCQTCLTAHKIPHQPGDDKVLHNWWSL